MGLDASRTVRDRLSINSGQGRIEMRIALQITILELPLRHGFSLPLLSIREGAETLQPIQYRFRPTPLFRLGLHFDKAGYAVIVALIALLSGWLGFNSDFERSEI